MLSTIHNLAKFEHSIYCDRKDKSGQQDECLELGVGPCYQDLTGDQQVVG